MKELLKNKLVLAGLLSIGVIIGIALLGWLWLRFTIPPSVDTRYAEAASDTHLQARLYYCLSGPERVYAIKALYAEENIDPETKLAGWIIYHTDTDMARNENGDPIMVDFNTSGEIVDQYLNLSAQEYPYTSCVPLKAEIQKAIP